MDTDFFEFFRTGQFGTNTLCFKKKIIYLGKLYICLFILMTFYSAIKEFFSMTAISNVHYMSFEIREMWIKIIVNGLILPVYSGITFWISLTYFDFKKIKISISAIIASFFCLAFSKYFYITVVKYEYVNLIFVFIIIFMMVYFCLSRFIPSTSVALLKNFWNDKFIILVYLFASLFALMMYLWGNGAFQTKLISVLVNVSIALILIYIRVIFGFKYAVLFHYALILPGLIVGFLW
jgi:hypothetical protein